MDVASSLNLKRSVKEKTKNEYKTLLSAYFYRHHGISRGFAHWEFYSRLYFFSCPARASATTDACIGPHIDELYDTILITRLILLIPMTLVFSIMVIKDADMAKLLQQLKILAAITAGLFFLASIEIFNKV
ncbi:MAG: hypothetical protein PHH59_04150 [Methylovulum sp.]|uniref:hypothetical protein n=1 Tax=Methylovulum sp. TaxID=1916980 RepID=UPI00263A2EAE|nr:hypothetical protein [Methylovulum sp.]MDD2723201.1 hypothetical protein [Methylovulum sp.]